MCRPYKETVITHWLFGSQRRNLACELLFFETF